MPVTRCSRVSKSLAHPAAPGMCRCVFGEQLARQGGLTDPTLSWGVGRHERCRVCSRETAAPKRRKNEEKGRKKKRK